MQLYRYFSLPIFATYFLSFLLLSSSLFAQIKHSSEAYQFLETRAANVLFPKDKSITNVNADYVYNWILNEIPSLKTEGTKVILGSVKESLTSKHFHFQQALKLNGETVPIYRATIQVNILKTGKIQSVIDNSYSIDKELQKELQKEFSKGENKNFTEQLKSNSDYLNSSLTILWRGADKPVIATLAETKEYDKEVIFDKNGNLLFENSLRTYNHHHKNKEGNCSHSNHSSETKSTTAMASGYIFNPDPLSTANAVYGQSGFIDNADADSPQLTNQLVEVDFEVSQETDGSYRLKNDYLEITMIEAPFIPVVTPTSPEFYFTRSQDGFEQVNAYYHITTFQEYLQSIGFNLLDDTRIFVDVHANNGDDNSFHSISGGIHRLRFGEGNVDDAEDADVIIHEYGHALSEGACSFCNFGHERKALDEAIGDYFATSYSRGINSFNWDQMFTWDGHNPFFAGRNMINNKHYPADVSSSDIYSTSELFSAAMMEIWGELGQEVTDKLMTNALYNFGQNISLETAAQILYLQDEALFGNIHQDVISTYFIKRGFFEYDANAGQDAIVCLGDGVQLGDPNLQLNNLEVFWEPSISLDDHTSLGPIAFPDEPTTYTLNIYDPSNGITITDQVFVDLTPLEDCLNYTTGNEIRLINTDRFMKGRSPLVIEVPEGSTEIKTKVYTSTGALLDEFTWSDNPRFKLDGSNLAAGVYIIKVSTSELKETFKVILTR